MILKILGWVFISISICIFTHYLFVKFSRLYLHKKVKYLGVFENRKYQELIDECKNIENKRYDNKQLSNEIDNMKTSLIELMNSETV